MRRAGPAIQARPRWSSSTCSAVPARPWKKPITAASRFASGRKFMHEAQGALLARQLVVVPEDPAQDLAPLGRGTARVPVSAAQ